VAPTPPQPVWKPFPGSPQERAYQSEADELFFGGAAGGGKTELLLGLALNRHKRSILFRREYPQLKGIIDRSREVIGPRGRFNANDNVWRLKDGRLIEFGAMQHEHDRERYQGRPHDLIGLDEGPHFLRSQFRFVIAWLRTDDPRQRCRAVMTGNPPLTAEGRWVVEEWGPWLDATHPDPAVPGELRWYTVLDEKLVWFKEGAAILHKGERIRPRSRTFIPAKVQDNPVYMATNYIATLQALPEPLRAQMLYGDFTAGTEDDAYQVIPTAWVRQAQARWTPRPPDGAGLSAIGVDVARGGDDQTVLAPRHRLWFGPLQKYPGRTTRDGLAVAGLVGKALHAARAPSALVCVDAIGVGAAAFDACVQRGWRVLPVIFSAGAPGVTDRAGVLHFRNVRAFAYWSLRELLDPNNPPAEQVALPPDPELLADLTAPRWSQTAAGVLVESKEDIAERIGRSTDCGDAVALATVLPPGGGGVAGAT
jgi:hypothetical protein